MDLGHVVELGLVLACTVNVNRLDTIPTWMHDRGVPRDPMESPCEPGPPQVARTAVMFYDLYNTK